MEVPKHVVDLIPKRLMDQSALVKFQQLHVWYTHKTKNNAIYVREDRTFIYASEVCNQIIQEREYEGEYIGQFNCKFVCRYNEAVPKRTTL